MEVKMKRGYFLFIVIVLANFLLLSCNIYVNETTQYMTSYNNINGQDLYKKYSEKTNITYFECYETYNFCNCMFHSVDALYNELITSNKNKTKFKNIFCKDKESSIADKKHIYNENDPNKNLFLRFLNNEIPIVNYNNGCEMKTVYFNDISSLWDIDDKRFFMVDMTGDGILEFCYLIAGCIEIIKYNEEEDSFYLWLFETNHHRPIGNGQMYFASYNLTTIFAYYVYDLSGSFRYLYDNCCNTLF
jgi:hypothetical protein